MVVGAVVLAAGSGTRLGQRKQFLELKSGERLVDRAVLTAAHVATWVGVVLPADHPWEGPPVDAVVIGGHSRHASLAAGLALIPPEVDIVVVHSASHPLATPELLMTLVAAVEAGADGAVPLHDMVDVIKQQTGDRLTTVGREGYGAAQCPMAFGRAALAEAFAGGAEGTEESEVVERAGGRVVAVPGEVTNLHVVDETSLAVARAIAASGISSGPGAAV